LESSSGPGWVPSRDLLMVTAGDRRLVHTPSPSTRKYGSPSYPLMITVNVLSLVSWSRSPLSMTATVMPGVGGDTAVISV
jgi:hypothetical protein